MSWGCGLGMAVTCWQKSPGDSFPISAVRVQKFCATTQFSAEKLQETGFVPPYTLQQGLERTLAAEFL